MTTNSITTRSPGKLIISGEHAVVHGGSALAIAINHYSTTTIESQYNNQKILFDLPNINYRKSLSVIELFQLKLYLERQYKKFLSGQCRIQEIILQPEQLIQYTVATFIEEFFIDIAEGFAIRNTSGIPIGCGLGSSAAMINSSLYALAHFFNIPWQNQLFFSLAHNIENLQHGHSSGLDVMITAEGNCIYYRGKQNAPKIASLESWFLVNTGIPQTNTGACVTHSKKYFDQNENLIKDFHLVTETISDALEKTDISKCKKGIQENHRLLMNIDVVPTKIQKFIYDLEKVDAAAKICGAGAIEGDNAGIVLVITEHEENIAAIAQNYGYTLMPIQGDSNGVHLI